MTKKDIEIKTLKLKLNNLNNRLRILKNESAKVSVIGEIEVVRRQIKALESSKDESISKPVEEKKNNTSSNETKKEENQVAQEHNRGVVGSVASSEEKKDDAVAIDNNFNKYDKKKK